MENLKNLEKIAKIFQPQNIITSEEIDQVLKGIMEILATYKKGTDAINEETKAVVNILLDKVVQSNKQTLDEAEIMFDDRMTDLETLLKDVKQMITDVETLASEVKDGKDADEEKIVEDVISRIKIDPTVVTVSAQEIKDKLSSLEGDNKLDISSIKGFDLYSTKVDLDYAVKTLQHQTSTLLNRTAVRSIVAGTNITVDNTDPSNPVVSSTGGGTPGGSDTQVQFNDGGSFGGDSKLTFNKTTGLLTITGKETLSPTITTSSGVDTILSISPTINQSSTAGYTALLVNSTETTTGSGTKLLADLQVGSASKFTVANTGGTTITNTTDSASNQILSLKGGRATPTANDEIYQSFSLNSSTGVSREIARIVGVASIVTNAGEQGRIGFYTMTSGTLAARAFIYSASFYPSTSGATDLGGTGNQWGNLFLGSAKKIDFNNGNATLTHSTGLLTSNVPMAAPQIYNADLVATVTSNAATITRASRNNKFTNSSAAAMTITLSTTGATAGDMLLVQIYDFSAAAQTITWVNTENSTVTVPATSNGSTTLPLTVGFKWNASTSKWRCIASA